MREVVAPLQARHRHERVIRRVQVQQVDVLRQVEAHQPIVADVQRLQRGEVLQPLKLQQGVSRQIQRADVPREVREVSQVGKRRKPLMAPIQGGELLRGPPMGVGGTRRAPPGGHDTRRHPPPRRRAMI